MLALDLNEASVSTSGVSSAEPYGWDWTSTTHEGRTGIVEDLIKALGTRTAARGKGKQGWSQSILCYDAGGYKLGAVYFGGGRDDVHVESTSSQADETRDAVKSIGHPRTARVDTRVDTLVSFDELRAVMTEVAGSNTRTRYIEGTMGGQSTGRTFYLGSPTSAVQVRLYEKWLESPGLYVDGCNRIEVQLRPPSRAKEMVSSWTREETFCASKLTRRLAQTLGTDLAEPASMQKEKRTPDLERSMEWMGRQYGGSFADFMSWSGGDLGRVLDYLAASDRSRSAAEQPVG